MNMASPRGADMTHALKVQELPSDTVSAENDKANPFVPWVMKLQALKVHTDCDPTDSGVLRK